MEDKQEKTKLMLQELEETYLRWEEEFFQRYRKYNQDALDAYANGILKVWEYISGERIRRDGQPFEVQNLKALVMNTAKFELINIWRKNGRNRDLVEALLTELDSTMIAVNNKKLEEPNQRVVALQHAFSKLGKKCKEIISLFYYEGYSLKEIAKIMDYSDERSAKTRLDKCRSTLRERI